jgi:hypothetical protein
MKDEAEKRFKRKEEKNSADWYVREQPIAAKTACK